MHKMHIRIALTALYRHPYLNSWALRSPFGTLHWHRFPYPSVGAMQPAGEDFHGVARHALYESVPVVDASAPKPGEVTDEGLRLTDTAIAIACTIFKQLVNALEAFAVVGLPPGVVSPGILGNWPSSS